MVNEGVLDFEAVPAKKRPKKVAVSLVVDNDIQAKPQPVATAAPATFKTPAKKTAAAKRRRSARPLRNR